MVKSIGKAAILFALLALVCACEPAATAVSPASTILSPSPTAIQPVATPTQIPSSTTSVPTEMPTATPTVTMTPTQVPPTMVPTATDYHVIVLFGTVIDGTGAAPIENAAIVIQDGYVTAVGSGTDVELPSDAHVIELRDATILPGFINSHVHNAYEPALLERWVQGGVTTVRDLGARHPFFRFHIRDKNNKDPNLATVVSAGPLVTVPGGYPTVGAGFPSLAVTNPDHARREIAQLISDGADVIKIAVDSGDGLPTLSLETASAIVESAHQRNVPVAAHIATFKDIRLVLDAGVDDFSHIIPGPIPGDILEQMVRGNVYWVPTLETAGGYDAGNLRRLIDAGGHVALGNDAGLLAGIEIGMPMREIRMMHAAGMSPMEVIVAATRDAAYVCNLKDTHGTLEVGKTADILVVNGDPLVDLQALADVLLVIHQGTIVRDSTQESVAVDCLGYVTNRAFQAPWAYISLYPRISIVAHRHEAYSIFARRFSSSPPR
jgi:imidazolonepropionase-like amidohydrolase